MAERTRWSHLKHHAHTNVYGKDPDMVLAGDPKRIPGSAVLMSVMSLLTPVLALVPPTRKLVPKWVGKRLGADARSEMDVQDMKLRVKRSFIHIKKLSVTAIRVLQHFSGRHCLFADTITICCISCIHAWCITSCQNCETE